jgi:hypothetical protein
MDTERRENLGATSLSTLAGPAALYFGWEVGSPILVLFGVVALGVAAYTAVEFALASRRPR